MNDPYQPADLANHLALLSAAMVFVLALGRHRELYVQELNPKLGTGLPFYGACLLYFATTYAIASENRFNGYTLAGWLVVWSAILVYLLVHSLRWARRTHQSEEPL